MRVDIRVDIDEVARNGCGFLCIVGFMVLLLIAITCGGR